MGADDGRLVVGLGNPGEKYRGTRHNVGFACVEELARGGEWREKSRFQAELCEIDLEGTPVLLVKPTTYMNLSGQAVRALVDFYRYPPDRILVVYDDFHLPVGNVRLRPSGSSGGQKGMESILSHLGTDLFPRLRIGIGPVEGRDVVGFVLSRFAPGEKEAAAEGIQKGAQAVRVWTVRGIETAMNRFNEKL